MTNVLVSHYKHKIYLDNILIHENVELYIRNEWYYRGSSGNAGKGIQDWLSPPPLPPVTVNRLLNGMKQYSLMEHS